MNTKGTYYGTPTKGVTGAASTGTPQMVVTFNVTHIADSEGGWQEIQPITATVYLFLSDGAWEYSEKKLKAMNFNGNFDSPEFACDGIELVCDHETYNNKTREKWDIAGGSEVKKADANQIRTLSAKWKQSAKPSSAPKPPGKPAAPPAAKKPAMANAGAAPIDPDEIPFTDGFSPCGH